ncbi:MAG: PQQ-binding-like beta-propeller repeat protein [Planctomycetales bacterium]|nr:PQQ-binding-like beta-propeller repeat protein [Planctomycetales bacterium]
MGQLGWWRSKVKWLLVALCWMPPYCMCADWPEFRGPTADGLVPHATLPTSWSPTKNVRWVTSLPGEGWSSPIVIKDDIFLTAAIPLPRTLGGQESGGYDLVLLKIDGQDGSLLEQLVLFSEPSSAPSIHQKNSHASPTPVFDGENLYVHFGHQGTACVSLSGEVLWRNDGLSYIPVHGGGGSPVVHGQLLIFSRDGEKTAEVTALDKRTGQVVWRLPRNVEADKKFSFCTPSVFKIDGVEQLILPGSGVVQSIDPNTGTELWRLGYDGYSVIPRPVYHAGLVFICTGYNRPSLLAIDPTGSGDVTATHLKWKNDSNIPHTPSILANEGQLVMVSDKGIALGINALTGAELWRTRLGGGFSASPILSGQLAYFISEDGECSVLKIDNPPQEVAKNLLGERCLASPAVIENDLLIRTAGHLYRFTNSR